MWPSVHAELEPGSERDASEGKGSGWLGPFLRLNMTPLALRRQQLHAHMPAILFVVGDYAALKAPKSSGGTARPQNYCFPRDLESFLLVARARGKHRRGDFILIRKILLIGSWAVLASHRLNNGALHPL